ncbi:MAG: ABC-F family ATP-binding cassette domain-containing protein [Bacteroidetes bacterium]|nr:ABC-F family ATP-binding cassette domain-containing protein [Bacteroidota bacterium]
MIDITNLSIQFTGKYLFEDTTFRINSTDKVALVGANGTGKSTLLKLVAGQEQPEAGNITSQRGIKIGYLPQEFTSQSTNSLFEEVKHSFDYIIELDKEEKIINEKLHRTDISDEQKEDLINRLGEIHHKKDDVNYYEIDSKIEKVLMGLGFSENDMIKRAKDFSGGWQMRIELAKILLGGNDLILLDEPTNHLDLDSLQWLIEFLMSFKGALMIVSHDKYFINKVTNKTLEIFNRKISYYSGNYDSYIKFKEERDEQIIAGYKNQQRKIKQTERFIERFRYKSTKSRQVQSRIKQLEKIEIIELPDTENEIELRFPSPPRSGVVPIEIKGISKSFGANNVLVNLDLQIERGDKIAFVGPNGAGKTTLSKIIAQKLNHDTGDIVYGHNTFISYYAQEVANDLDLDKDLIETLQEISKEHSPLQLRSLLGNFLFSDDDVFKKVKVLSGGEKSRVALAKILLTKANLIVLDEPTNHLDIKSKQILQNALMEFEGTLILVSHDIDFMTPIVNKVLELRPGTQKMFPGGIEYYLLKRVEQSEAPKSEKLQTDKSNRKDQKRIEAETRKKKSDATKDLRKEVETLESAIESLEDQKLKIEKELADEKIYSNPELAKTKNNEYEKIKSNLEETFLKWTDKSHVLEEIEKQFDI